MPFLFPDDAMPYEIKQSAKGYCVHKQGDDAPVPGGCHKSKSAALRHMRALYANEPEAMKAEGKGYGARAGETIQGNLVRGSDGKFSSSGAGSDKPTTEEKPRARRQKLGRTEAARAAAKLQAREDKKRATAGASEAKRQARRAETERRRAAIKKQQADAKARQLAANRKAVIDATQLDETSLSALEAFAKGGNLGAGDTTDALIALGLVTRSPTTGEYVMTGPGKSLLSAVKSGDIRQAKDAENAGREARARARQQRSNREKPAETLKHGKHNQAAHGRRYSSSRKQLRATAHGQAVAKADKTDWNDPLARALMGSRESFVENESRRLYREAIAQRTITRLVASDLSHNDRLLLQHVVSTGQNADPFKNAMYNSKYPSDAHAMAYINKNLVARGLATETRQGGISQYSLTSEGRRLLESIVR